MASILPQNTWSLRKEIFDYLSSQIEKGALIPGSLINVRKLTAELNVSRTPLREALAQLEIQGLVSILPQRGVRINVLMYEDLLDRMENRFTPARMTRMALIWGVAANAIIGLILAAFIKKNPPENPVA